MDCPFCDPPESLVVASNDLARAVRDAYPVNPGHTLVVPCRHVASWFDISPDERSAMLNLVDEVRRLLEAERVPAGYNIGVNIGEAAGQTVPHMHLHVIPRYAGDVDDPSGGVRFVIPARGNYRRPGHIPTVKE